jgi:hypothetical protein
MSDTIPTKDRLAQDLEAAGAPAFMLRKAKAGEYDDYESASATPIVDLVRDCLGTGKAALRAIAEAAKQGKYDATKAEADAWFAREGKDLLR